MIWLINLNFNQCQCLIIKDALTTRIKEAGKEQRNRDNATLTQR